MRNHESLFIVEELDLQKENGERLAIVNCLPNGLPEDFIDNDSIVNQDAGWDISEDYDKTKW